jgi:hypothetical protein
MTGARTSTCAGQASSKEGASKPPTGCHHRRHPRSGAWEAGGDAAADLDGLVPAKLAGPSRCGRRVARAHVDERSEAEVEGLMRGSKTCEPCADERGQTRHSTRGSSWKRPGRVMGTLPDSHHATPARAQRGTDPSVRSVDLCPPQADPLCCHPISPPVMDP